MFLELQTVIVTLFVNFFPFSRLLRQAGITVGLFYSPNPQGLYYYYYRLIIFLHSKDSEQQHDKISIESNISTN